MSDVFLKMGISLLRRCEKIYTVVVKKISGLRSVMAVLLPTIGLYYGYAQHKTELALLSEVSHTNRQASEASKTQSEIEEIRVGTICILTYVCRNSNRMQLIHNVGGVRPQPFLVWGKM